LQSKRKKRLVTALYLAAVILIVLTLGLLQAFCPLRTLVPAYALPARAEGEMRLHFLDVGQADCTLVEFPDGDVLVIDGGDGSFYGKTKVARYLKGLAPTAVSLLLTHADIDHYGGFTQLFDMFDIKTLYLPAVPSENAAYKRLLERAQEANCAMQPLSRYGVISRPSGAYVNCISPYSAGETDENDASAVLWISYGGVNALLCGDIPASREERLMTEYSFDETLFDKQGFPVRLPQTHILKVAHHGAKTSSSKQWLSFLGAEKAIVSCGRGNAYSHPAEETLNNLSVAGCEIYRTDELGDITISVYNGGYAVQTNLSESHA
jgi:beta-lactamase superfamily II metal-dependent hydrolase